MKKFYFLLLFVFTWSLCTANYADQKNALRLANKSIAKVQQVMKTNIDKLPLKSAMAQNHLDSIILSNSSQGHFFYNEKGLLSDYMGYVRAHEGGLRFNEHQQFEYDDAGRQILFVQKFNDLIDGWIILEKIETEYDTNGNVISEVYWSYDDYEAAHPYEKTEYEYNGTEMRSNYYTWNEISEDWMLESYTNFIVDGQKLVSGEMFMYDEDSGGFLTGIQIDIEYNSADLEISYRLRMYDEESETWGELMSTESEYDASNRLTLERETMQMLGMVINYIDETHYTYEAGKLVKTEEFSNKGYLPELQLSGYWVYEYNGDVLRSETYFMSNGLGDFIASSKNEFEYDANVNPSNYYIPYVSVYSDDYYHLDEEYHQSGLLKKVKHNTISDWDTYEMVETMVADYFYSGQSSVVLSSDASLSSIELDGSVIDGFATAKRSYNVELPTGTEVPPVVSASASNAKATVNIEQASALPGEASVMVTAEDGETIVEYTIQFSVGVGVSAISMSDVEIYPLPCSRQLTVINNADCVLQAFELVSVAGQTVVSGKMTGVSKKYNIETEELEDGIYILTLIFENEQRKYQRILKH